MLLLFVPLAAGAQTAEQVDVVAPVQPAAVRVDGAAVGQSGATSLGALLGDLPQFGNQGIGDAQDDNGFGEDFVDLRNLNFNRTLVLVDGSRFVLSGIQTDEAVDLNTIPAPFVERIEVQDGSQPLVAADAVAGSVDVRLKRDVEGVQVTAYGGAAGAGDDGTAEVSLVAGRAFGDVHATIGLDLLQRDPIVQSDRSWARDPITGVQDGVDEIGSEATPGGHAVGAGVDALALGDGASRPYDAGTDNYNFSGGRYLQGGLRRASGVAAADWEPSAALTAAVSVLYTDRSATTLQPPQTLGLTGTDKHPDGFVVPAADPYNPFGVPVTLERVVTEAGAQQTTTSGPVWRVTGKLGGLFGGWDWNVSVDHGESSSEYTTPGQINLTRALQTVGDGSCLASAGCVAADWFGPDSLSAEALEYVRYTSRVRSHYAETVGDASAKRDLAALPGGAMRLTLGVEARTESGATSVDAVTAAGDQAGEDAAPTSGGYSTQEAFGALDLPVLRGVRGAERLDATLEARETRTSRYGSFPTLRAVVEYAPVSGVTLRATSSTSRRPPAIAEAFGGVTANPLPVTDPCDATGGLRANAVVERNCLAQGLADNFEQASPVIDVASGGNPALHPERAETETLGATVAPAAWPFMTVKAEWWRYRITDAIDSLADTDANLIPDTCYLSVDLSSPLCALITRIPGGGDAGQISRILGLDENIGTIKTSGVDFGASLTMPLRGGMRATVDWQTTWLLDYRIRSTGQSGFTQYAGTIPGLDAVGSYARVRSRARVGMQGDDWAVGWTGRFISGARVSGAAGSAPDVLYQDLDLRRSVGRVTLSAGVRNLADTRPPLLLDGETNTDVATYDVVGRFAWVSASCWF